MLKLSTIPNKGKLRCFPPLGSKKRKNPVKNSGIIAQDQASSREAKNTKFQLSFFFTFSFSNQFLSN